VLTMLTINQFTIRTVDCWRTGESWRVRAEEANRDCYDWSRNMANAYGTTRMDRGAKEAGERSSYATAAAGVGQHAFSGCDV
jgi:hypothetical protein